jgi:hypothetical protein
MRRTLLAIFRALFFGGDPLVTMVCPTDGLTYVGVPRSWHARHCRQPHIPLKEEHDEK